MARIGKWLLPVLIVLEGVLVWSGLVDLRAAIAFVVGLEILLLLVASRQIIVAIRRYRQSRAAGLDLAAATEDGLVILLPRKIARLITLEPALWYCLGIWLVRRRPSNPSQFPYHQRSILGALVIAVMVSAPVEILLFELLIPWPWLRWLLLITSIYAVLWMLGLYASLVVRPHGLEAETISLQYGVLARARIPYREIRAVSAVRRRAPGGGDGLKWAPDENAAYLAVGGRTDVAVELHHTQVISTRPASTTPVATIYAAVDDPTRFVLELQRRLADDSGSTSQSEPGMARSPLPEPGHPQSQ